MATGIYIVDVETQDTATRSIVIAESAAKAGEAYDREGTTVTVGRIGNYEPGITGAHQVAYEEEIVIGPMPR